MFEIWVVLDERCLRCAMLGIWDDKCVRCWDARYLGCEKFWMWDIQDVRCLGGGIFAKHP